MIRQGHCLLITQQERSSLCWVTSACRKKLYKLGSEQGGLVGRCGACTHMSVVTLCHRDAGSLPGAGLSPMSLSQLTRKTLAPSTFPPATARAPDLQRLPGSHLGPASAGKGVAGLQGALPVPHHTLGGPRTHPAALAHLGVTAPHFPPENDLYLARVHRHGLGLSVCCRQGWVCDLRGLQHGPFRGDRFMPVSWERPASAEQPETPGPPRPPHEEAS